jgi:hypothetical protein
MLDDRKLAGAFSIFNNLKSSTKPSPVGGRVAVAKNDTYSCFVIPGVTRNPVSFHSITLLDAGSDPA